MDIISDRELDTKSKRTIKRGRERRRWGRGKINGEERREMRGGEKGG